MGEKARYEISSSFNEEILEIVIKGEVSARNFGNVVGELNELIRTNKAKKAIADFRAIDRRLDTADMYRYFRNYEIILFEIQYAIVDHSENIEYKTAAIDAGLTSLMWFNDMESAREWIRGSSQSNPYGDSSPIKRLYN